MEYTKVDAAKINEMIQDGILQKMTVVKDVPVKAIELTQQAVDNYIAEGGYKTVVVDDEGKLFEETSNKKLNAGDFLVTNMIEGYENSYVVPAAKFTNLYTKGKVEGIFNPVATDKTVYAIPEGVNLVFEAPWGGDMKIRAGGVIVPDGDKFYGINPEEFKATHSVKEPKVVNNVSETLNSVRSTSENKNGLKPN